MPLKMENTAFEYIDFPMAQIAIPYENTEDQGYTDLPITGTHSSGKLRTTVPDLARFLMIHMNQGELEGTQIVEPSSVELMHARTNQMSGFDFPGMSFLGVGYGWTQWGDGWQGHSGATPGYFAQMLMRETDSGSYGVILMMTYGCSITECDFEWFDKYFETIRDLLLEEAEKVHLGLNDTNNTQIDFPPDNPIYASYYQDWWTYKNATYGFSFLVPPDWIVDETASSIPLLRGHLLTLRPQDEDQNNEIRLTFRHNGEDVRLWPTGVGEGEFVEHETLDVAGAPARRMLLVCPTGEIGAIWYQGENLPEIQLGDLEFAFIYRYRDMHCQEGYSLDGKVRQQGEMILASLQVP
jgi:hypothetical protein